MRREVEMNDKTMLELAARYVVKKEAGSHLARVVHVPSGRVVKQYNILKRDGWAQADRHCAALNKQREPAAAEIGKGSE